MTKSEKDDRSAFQSAVQKMQQCHKMGPKAATGMPGPRAIRLMTVTRSLETVIERR